MSVRFVAFPHFHALYRNDLKRYQCLKDSKQSNNVRWNMIRPKGLRLIRTLMIVGYGANESLPSIVWAIPFWPYLCKWSVGWLNLLLFIYWIDFSYKTECPPRYNLSLVDGYKHALLADLMEPSRLESTFANTVIRIPMPNRSLIVLYGPSRYQWEHCVLREDIHQRRVCVAYREFTIPYLPDDDGPKNTTKQIELGKLVLDQSKLFWDHHKDMAIVTSS